MKLSLVSFLKPQWIFQFVWHNYCWSKLSFCQNHKPRGMTIMKSPYPFHHHISGDLTVYIVGKIRKVILLLLCPSFFPLSTPWNENFNLLVRIKSLNLFLYRSLNKFTGPNKVLLVLDLGQNDRCSSWGLYYILPILQGAIVIIW